MLKTYLKTVLSTIWPDRLTQPPSTYLLGRPHDLSTPTGLDYFEAEFKSHLLFTYRHSISALSNREKENWVRTLLTKHRLKKSISSDGGWGCTIRVFQMAMAQVILTMFLENGGQKWWSESEVEDLHALVKTVNYFCDNETAPFSIHNITTLGQTHLKLPLTTWYGPTSCAQLMSIILNDLRSINEKAVRCLHFDDTCINVPEVKRSIEAVGMTSGAVVILLSMRLGLECVDLVKYKSFITDLFKLNQFNGLCGGDCKTSAYYFIACNDDYLYYLDPHVKVQSALLSVNLEQGGDDDNNDQGDGELSHRDAGGGNEFYLVINDTEKLTIKQCVGVLLPDRSRQLAWKLLNPSMTVSFLCRSFDDLADLREQLGSTIYFDDKEKKSSELDDQHDGASLVTPQGDDEYLLV